MKVVALVSGGKDSVYSMMKCVSYGHDILCIATLQPIDTNAEVDSFMFQSIGTHLVESISKCMELPWINHTLNGKSIATDMGYDTTEGDEVEDLYILLKKVKEKFPQVQGVSTGAIFSNYQRTRVEHVCSRLNLVSFAYLWRRDQDELMQEMIESNLNSILVKVASMGLHPKRHLGRSIADLYPTFLDLHEKYQFHICGEGGEYETLTLDCPLFKKRIVIDEAHIRMHSDDMFAPVGLYCIESLHLEEKNQSDIMSLSSQATTSSILTGFTAPIQTISNRIGKKRSHCFRDQVYLSGVIASSPTLSIADQVHSIFKNIGESLEEYGISFSDVAFVHVYVNDMTIFNDVNAVFAQYFPSNPPSRSCVQISMEAAILMDCWAVKRPSSREILHVQSISEWAPTCIGPYSQANKLHSSLILSAGQIPLLPGTMALSTSDSLHLCLSNVLGVLEAVDSNLRHVVAGISYSTNVDECNQLRDRIRPFLVSNLKRRDIYEMEDESDESDDEVDKLDKKILLARVSPICSIVVPTLPRGAPLELEFLALTHAAFQLFSPVGYSLNDNHGYHSEWSIASRGLLVGFLYASAIIDSASVRTHITRVLRHANMSWSNVLHIRVHHISVAPDLDDLDIPLTYVPVLHIAHESTPSIVLQVIAYNGEVMETDLWLAKKI